jgi:transcriptional regulator GlxA family with amidase domain
MPEESFLRNSESGSPVKVVFLLLPNFSLTAFTAAIEPLRLANYVSGKELYYWETCAIEGKPVTASLGATILPFRAVEDVRHPDNVIICGGMHGHTFNDRNLNRVVKRWASAGTHIGALDAGTFVLARTGLLDERKCTIHWEFLDSFVEEFPEIDVRPSLYEIDGKVFTCAGGDAAGDMMLNEIAGRLGHEVAGSVSEQLMHERIRDGSDIQHLPVHARLRISHPQLVKAIREMEQNMEDPLTRDEIARRVNLSQRQLERLFRRYLNTTPARHYLRLRLLRARHLLLQTTLSITGIAVASGFCSTSHFSRCYREVFGHSPRDERRWVVENRNTSPPQKDEEAAEI